VVTDSHSAATARSDWGVWRSRVSKGGSAQRVVCLEGRGSGEKANSDWEEMSEWVCEEGGEKASTLMMPVGKGEPCSRPTESQL
jgi:hypothetical protein